MPEADEDEAAAAGRRNTMSEEVDTAMAGRLATLDTEEPSAAAGRFKTHGAGACFCIYFNSQVRQTL